MTPFSEESCDAVYIRSNLTQVLIGGWCQATFNFLRESRYVQYENDCLELMLNKISISEMNVKMQQLLNQIVSGNETTSIIKFFEHFLVVKNSFLLPRWTK